MIAPAIKAAPSNSPHALAVVRHRFSAVIEIVAVRYNTDPKDMETKVQRVIRRTLAVRYHASAFFVRITQHAILMAAGDC